MEIDTVYLSELDLQTLADDKRHQYEVLENHTSVFFRPDDRTEHSHPTYWDSNREGVSFIGFIEEYGSHKTKTPPVFFGERVPVRVLQRKVKKIREVTPDEYQNAYEEIMGKESLVLWIKNKYPERRIDEDSVVTVYTVEY